MKYLIAASLIVLISANVMGEKPNQEKKIADVIRAALKQLNENPPIDLKLDGAEVASSTDASKIAIIEYMKKVGGLDAQVSTKDVSLVHLGYSIFGFANAGDKIWQVFVTKPFTKPGFVFDVIWIHPDTEKVHFVAGAWEALEQK